MKITLAQVVLAVLFVGVSRANDVSAQELLNRPVSVRVQNQNIKSVLNLIEKNADVRFSYSPQVVSSNRLVSFSADNASLKKVLDDLLTPLNVDYVVSGKHIILSRRTSPDKAENPAAQPTPQQVKEKQVSGKIVDEKESGLPGVSIVLKGTQRGTTSDVEGRFSLAIPDEISDATLIISFVGYKKQEILIGSQTDISVVLLPDNQTLEEIVVVGYGKQSRADLIGSVSQINADKIGNRTTTQLSQSLTGQLPGVNISQSSGQPGKVDANKIQIRGIGSFGANTDPLIIVDGIPTSSFNNINPNDVESISVLKDASSAAIYGARAANGVILVTTKTGKEGKIKVSYNGYVGFQKMTATPEFVGSAEYARLINEVTPNTYTDAQIQAFADGSDPDNYPNSDFVKSTLKNSATQTSHNATISSGSKNTQFLLSFGYLHQDGIIAKNKFDRYNLRLNVTNELSKKLRLTTRLSAIQSSDNQPAPPTTLDFNDMVTLISQVVRFAPTMVIKKSNGDWGTGLANKGTPVSYVASDSYFKSRTTDLMANTRLDWDVTEDLTLSAIGGYTQLGQQSKRFLSSQRLTSTINLSPSSLNQIDNTNQYKTFQAFADYKKSIGAHYFGVLAGYSFESYYEDQLSLSRSNLPTNNVVVIDAGDANSQTTSGTAAEWALESYFGRLQYNYAHKYLVEGAIRYDGSSRFPSTRKYAVFPSVAGGWRVSEENFLKNRISWLNELKLKASYGILGNQNIGNYPYQNVLSTGSNYAFGNVLSSGVARKTITDTTLHWESTRTTDFGIELGLFKKKLQFSATYFDKYTYDILVSPAASVSKVLGFTVGQQNSGSMSNKGWEFTLQYQNRLGDFNYSVGANMTYLKNAVLDLGVGNVLQPNGLTGNGSTLFIGQPMNLYYGYETDGLFVDQEDINNWVNQSAIAPNAKPGDVRYKDISGPNGVPDGKVDATYDRKVIGGQIPKLNYGFNLSGSYKGFDLFVLLQGVGGVNGLLNNYAGWALYNQSNIQRWQADGRWTAANPDRYAEYPRLEQLTNQGSNNTLLSSYWMLNGSFLRLKAVQVGYTVPATLSQKLKLDHVRFYVNAENLRTWSNYRKGWDPEINSSGPYYPILANYTFGLNINF